MIKAILLTAALLLVDMVPTDTLTEKHDNEVNQLYLAGRHFVDAMMQGHDVETKREELLAEMREYENFVSNLTHSEHKDIADAARDAKHAVQAWEVEARTVDEPLKMNAFWERASDAVVSQIALTEAIK